MFEIIIVALIVSIAVNFVGHKLVRRATAKRLEKVLRKASVPLEPNTEANKK